MSNEKPQKKPEISQENGLLKGSVTAAGPKSGRPKSPPPTE